MEPVLSSHALSLGVADLVIATFLIGVVAAVSIAMRLGLEKQLAIASIRTVAQLFLIGFVLKRVFAMEDFLVIFLLGLIMAVIAGRAAVARPKRTFSGITWRACLTLVLVGFVTMVSVTAVIIGVDPWYKPQYAIPLLGMILGNSLTGLSLTIDSILESLAERRREVEMELSLGATSWEAARAPLSDAMRRGMTPIINSMMVVGVVSLPGMMTGQILEGADPVNAVKYQIVVMFMLAAATALSSLMMALFIYRRLFNSRHQLRGDIIRGAGK